MIAYIGRQPIFDHTHQSFAYELLYRSCDENNSASFQESDKATARVIINLVHNLGVQAIIGQKIGFINVDETSLFSDALLLLPKESFWFEILEHTKITLALCERIKHLHTLGYHFVLDDFDCSDASIAAYQPLFKYISIVKIDILAIGVEHLESALAKLSPFKLTLLAEKIESYEVFETCLKFPFSYFQGYFFEKPLILSGTKIEPDTLSAMRIMQCIQQSDDPKEISAKFSTCPELVYNLLRHINSGAYHFRKEISNIYQMITLLGPKKLLSWLGLFLYGNPKERPFGEELFNNAKFRAKFMESLALKCNDSSLATSAFLAGSLSVIDAYLGISMEAFLRELHLNSAIKDALSHKEGPLGKLLSLAEKMNHADAFEDALQATDYPPCFSKQSIYEACYEANLFVEQTNQNKEKS